MARKPKRPRLHLEQRWTDDPIPGPYASITALPNDRGEIYLQVHHDACGMSHTWLSSSDAHALADFIRTHIPA